MRKLDPEGRPRIAYDGLAAGEVDGWWMVEARWKGGPSRIGPAVMESGDPCREFYRPGGCAVVLQLMAPDGSLRGFYCDLSAPVQVGAAETGSPLLAYRDAVLDLFVHPEGRLTLLDAREFVEGVCSGRASWAAAQAVAGLAEVLGRWLHGQPPFGPLPGQPAQSPQASGGTSP